MNEIVYILYIDTHPLNYFSTLNEAKEERKKIKKVMEKFNTDIPMPIRQKILKGGF